MVLTLANVLQIPITIFTSIPNMPVFCIMPTTQTATSTQPLYLVYSQDSSEQPGHYDYVAPLGNEPETSHHERVVRCTCGRKQKLQNSGTTAACSTMRCPCIRGKSECTNACICKQCTNQFGVRPLPSTTRRRQMYENQRYPLRGKSTTDFMQEKSEKLCVGSLTDFESLLLKEIIIHCIIYGIEISPNNVFTIYTNIFHLAQHCSSIEFPLFRRNMDVVKKVLKNLAIAITVMVSLFVCK